MSMSRNGENSIKRNIGKSSVLTNISDIVINKQLRNF